MKTVITEFNGSSFIAERHESTKEFFGELIELFRKHNLIIVPVDSEHNVDFHNGMRVIPCLEEFVESLKDRTGVCVGENSCFPLNLHPGDEFYFENKYYTVLSIKWDGENVDIFANHVDNGARRIQCHFSEIS